MHQNRSSVALRALACAVALGLAAGGLAACGQKGPLVLDGPPRASAPAR